MLMKKGFTTWSPFKETTKYFAPSSKDFMINYRVENLDALVEQLKKDSVISDFEYRTERSKLLAKKMSLPQISTSIIGIAGTFTPGAGTYTITGSAIDFNGAGAQTIPAFAFNNI